MITKNVNSLLSDPNLAIEVLGAPLEAGYAVDSQRFRLGRSPQSRGPEPELILCSLGAYPRLSDSLLELPLDAIPARHILGPTTAP